MPRKTSRDPPARAGRPAASMRPRPDAAENFGNCAKQAQTNPASMRPRPDAAENCADAWRSSGRRWASMRPRPDAAENVANPDAFDFMPPASIRPRPDAAENVVGRLQHLAAAVGFNEAAARCRGKLRPGLPPPQREDGASMRPRPDAAENVHQAVRLLLRRAASMRPRPDAAENAASDGAVTVALELQ